MKRKVKFLIPVVAGLILVGCKQNVSSSSSSSSKPSSSSISVPVVSSSTKSNTDVGLVDLGVDFSEVERGLPLPNIGENWTTEFTYTLSFNTFSCFLKVGLLNVIMMQTLINLCVVVGLLPVTGITLPLISYGGSSLVITLFSLGIIAQKGDYDEIYTISKQHSRTHLSLFRNR